MEDKLTLEIFKELKKTIKRYFIAFMILLFLFFATNIAWMIAWNLPSEDTTTTYEQTNEDDGDNNFIGDDGDINNGTHANSDEKNDKAN